MLYRPFRSLALAGAVLAVALLTGPSAAYAEDPPKVGWADSAELSFVATSGNSESSTFGFKNTLTRTWTAARFELKLGGIKVESTTEDALVDATNPPDIVVVETTDTTAEAYFLNGRYDREISKKFFWFAGAGWERNEFAGIENRYAGFGGVGNRWWDEEDLKFRTDYGVTFTKQEDVVEVAGTDDTFAGLRFSWAYLNKLGKNTTYTNDLVVDENLDETSDWRADMLHGLSVSMSERLALKVGWRWLYDHMPSFELLTASVDTAGNPVVPAVTELVELDEFDSIFTVSLVVNF
jgi:putative salt-induced outer membrane protein YdiY